MWLFNADTSGGRARRLDLLVTAGHNKWLAFTSRTGVLNIIHCTDDPYTRMGPKGPPTTYQWALVDPATCDLSVRDNHLGWDTYNMQEHMYHPASHQVVSVIHQHIAIYNAESGQRVVDFMVDLQHPPAAFKGTEVSMLVGAIRWAPSGKLLAILLQDRRDWPINDVRCHDTASGHCVHSIAVHAYLPSLSWSPSADMLIIWSSSGPAKWPDIPRVDGIMLLDPARQKSMQLIANTKPMGQDFTPLTGRRWSDVRWTPCGSLLVAWNQNGGCFVMDPASGQRIAAAEQALSDGARHTSLVASPSLRCKGQKAVEALVGDCAWGISKLLRIHNSSAGWRVTLTQLENPYPTYSQHCHHITPNGGVIVGETLTRSSSDNGNGFSIWHHDLRTHAKHITCPKSAKFLRFIEWAPMPPAWPSVYACQVVRPGCEPTLELCDTGVHQVLASWTLAHLLYLAGSQKQTCSAQLSLCSWSKDGQHLAVLLKDQVLVMTFSAPA